MAPGFTFLYIDLVDKRALSDLFRAHCPARIVHRAAQAGVRYFFENPQAYVDSNVAGFVNLLECARAAGNLEHVVYASSSSVYRATSRLHTENQWTPERPRPRSENRRSAIT
jgi:UDP-glucuronate 4-epimerase